MEGIFVDILICAVFFITVGVFTYRGFAKSVMGFVVIVASFIVAKAFGPTVGLWLHENVILEPMKDAVESLLARTVGDAVSSIDANAIINSIPEAVVNALSLAGVGLSQIRDAITNTLENGGDTIVSVATHIAEPISLFLSEVVAYLSVFILSFIALRIAAYLIVGIMKLPILRTLNGFLGFLMGTVAGYLLSWGFAVMFRAVMGMLAIKYPALIPFSETAGSEIYAYFIGL